MKTLRYLVIAIPFLLVTTLSCNGASTPPSEPLTEEELTNEVQTDVAAFNDLTATVTSQSTTAASLGQLPPLPSGTSLSASLFSDMLSPNAIRSLGSGLRTLQDSSLPRGTYVYNSSTMNWSMSSSDTLVLRWPFQNTGGGSSTAELTIDWDDGSNTVVVSDGFETVEVPTSARIVHRIDGNVVLDLSLDASWYNTSSCGASGGISEPTSLDLNGTLTESSGTISVDASLTNDGDTIATDGEVNVDFGGDEAEVNWDISVEGQRQRGSDCFTSDFTVDNGSISLGTSSVVDGTSSSLGFSVDFDSVTLGSSGELVSVGLSNGEITVDGRVAASFSGTLDDSNGNGIPGENVTVTVSNGTTNLEALLNSGGVAPVALRGAAALRSMLY